MGELRKFVTAEFVFGNGARFLAGRYASNLGASRVLLVTDHGIMGTGLVDDVTGSLSEEGLDYVIFSDVTPNPRDHEVMDGAEVFDAEECNMIVCAGRRKPH